RPSKRQERSTSRQTLLPFASTTTTRTEAPEHNTLSSAGNVHQDVQFDNQYEIAIDDIHGLGGLLIGSEQNSHSPQNEGNQVNNPSIEENIFRDNLIEENALEDEPFYEDENILDDDTGYREAQDGVLERYFLSIQNRLSQERYPTEYSLGTFWISPRSPFFALRNNALDPDMLCHPRVFLWIPHLLVEKRLRCPTCHHPLETKGYNKNPYARRVIDIESGCSVTINGYDQRVMEQVPDHLASEFPAYLTHRCAISKAVGNLLRPCIQNGMGVERFRHTLQELHTLQHDRLELQYLNSVAYRRQYPTLDDMLGSSQQLRSFSRFDDPTRYAGYIPSTAYLRLVYTTIMDQLRPLIDKQMMQIGGQILKGDHSFKIIKHMAKIGSAPVFSALYTVCNEYEEIRMQVLVPSKSLTHLRNPFQQMMHSYRVYGHKPPELFFTDNVRGDQQFLEEVLPSLTASENRETNATTCTENEEIAREHHISPVNRRIFKDIFHLMDMVKVPKRHGLAKEFSRRLRDAIFVVDSEDRRLLETYLAAKNITWNYMLSTKPSWVLRRVKRVVPPPEELLPVVDNLFKEYGPLICSRTGIPLFDQEAWRQASHVLEAIRLGHVSDPSGYSLYFKIGHDENQLPLYRCSRGTNTLEGGVHQNIIRKFMSFGAGPHLTDSVLADYRLRHNIDVGTMNRYGRIHKGHYEPWLVTTISAMRKRLGIPDYTSSANESNDSLNDTEPNLSKETFGIVCFPRNLAEDLHVEVKDRTDQNTSQVDASLSAQMSTYLVLQSVSMNNPKGQMYKYLADKQGTKYAVVPVHTPEEFALFRHIMNQGHNARCHEDWPEMAKSWNTNHANGTTIFYKTPEHLKSHYSVWDERRIANESIAASADVCDVMREHLQSPGRALAIMPAQIPLPIQVSSPAQIPMSVAETSRQTSYLADIP
ncbi:hypothetical protein EC973_007053, partial [Apophysomyces ossiformis]